MYVLVTLRTWVVQDTRVHGGGLDGKQRGTGFVRAYVVGEGKLVATF